MSTKPNILNRFGTEATLQDILAETMAEEESNVAINVNTNSIVQQKQQLMMMKMMRNYHQQQPQTQFQQINYNIQNNIDQFQEYNKRIFSNSYITTNEVCLFFKIKLD